MKKIILLAAVACISGAQAVCRVGIIGADTYHSVALAKYQNGPKADSAFSDFKVVVVYKGGVPVRIADVLREARCK